MCPIPNYKIIFLMVVFNSCALFFLIPLRGMKIKGNAIHFEVCLKSNTLRWEDVLRLERSGDVTEISTGCKENEYVIWDVLYNREYYKQILTHEIIDSLKDLWNKLGEVAIGSVSL